MITFTCRCICLRDRTEPNVRCKCLKKAIECFHVIALKTITDKEGKIKPMRDNRLAETKRTYGKEGVGGKKASRPRDTTPKIKKSVKFSSDHSSSDHSSFESNDEPIDLSFRDDLAYTPSKLFRAPVSKQQTFTPGSNLQASTPVSNRQTSTSKARTLGEYSLKFSK